MILFDLNTSVLVSAHYAAAARSPRRTEETLGRHTRG